MRGQIAEIDARIQPANGGRFLPETEFEEALIIKLCDGLRKAGPDIPDEPATAD